MMRGSAAAWMRPNTGLDSVVTGSSGRNQLNALNASMRASMPRPRVDPQRVIANAALTMPLPYVVS